VHDHGSPRPGRRGLSPRVDAAAYFTATGISGFYPEVVVVFEVTDPKRHHHVPLLLSPFAYSTYRGS
jgi:5-hydroxyisourate hydrolase